VSIAWLKKVSSIHSRRLLECIEDTFLSQAIDSPTTGEVKLDLLVSNTSELISDVKMEAAWLQRSPLVGVHSPEG